MGNFLSGKPSRLLAGDNEGPLSGQDDAGAYEPPISVLEPHPGGPRGVDEGPVQLELLGPVPLGPRLPAGRCRGRRLPSVSLNWPKADYAKSSARDT